MNLNKKQPEPEWLSYIEFPFKCNRVEILWNNILANRTAGQGNAKLIYKCKYIYVDYSSFNAFITDKYIAFNDRVWTSREINEIRFVFSGERSSNQSLWTDFARPVGVFSQEISTEYNHIMVLFTAETRIRHAC